MLVLLGILLVFFSTLGGFMLAGGHPAVLLHASEFVVIFGIAVGILVIASPGRVLSDLTAKARLAFSSKKPGKGEYFELLKLLYEIFMVGRRNGLIALEEHVMEPDKSAIFQRYPVVTAHHERMEFLCNGLRPVIDGKIKPDQLEALMEVELAAKAEEADHPVHVLQMVGDSLPGIGIVAAVLGIINTMAAIADGPSVVGERVAAALTGTLLGVFSAYGFVNPMATRIKFNNAHDEQYLRCILAAVAGFAKGLAPVTAVEVARRSLDSGVQPSVEEFEAAVKGLNVATK
jgi:chemotaxis protein MotA